MYKKMFLGTLILVLLIPALTAGEITGKIQVKGVRNSADAVVYIDTIQGTDFAAPEEHAVVDQKEMVFVPHVLPVLVGTTVDFLNSDAVLHNVFTPEKCAEKFNLGSWPQGQSRSFTFKQPCAAVLLCNVHPEMEAFVVAVPTPYYAVTDKAGNFKISNIPDGEYTLKVWHPKKKKELVEKVSVSATTTLTLELK